MHRRSLISQGWFWLLVFMIIFLHKPVLRVFFVLDYREPIMVMSRNYGIDAHLLSAIIFVESRFDEKAESGKGALGLMQIMPATGEWASQQLEWSTFKKNDLLNPQKNIMIGCWYLHYLQEYFGGNEIAALAAYNAGHRYVQGWIDAKLWDGDMVKIEQIPFSETKQYLFQINLIKKIYRYLYPEI